MLQAIQNRRSIRKYKKDEVPVSAIEEVLRAGMLAPSSKNRQPWRFIVAAGREKERFLDAMRSGLEREKTQPLLPESACYLGGAENTLRIMEQAPVLILILNTLGVDLHAAAGPEERIFEICNAQSIGAAVQNMTLAATELGLGSLWICDTYFAYQELCSWAGGELAAVMALGYPDEEPGPRPRKRLEEAAEWRI